MMPPSRPIDLLSLIGKNVSTETWFPIQSISGTRVVLDGPYGYYGVSETVTGYKRETIKASSGLGTVNDSGTVGSPITIDGGYDRTNMSTKNLETWLDGVALQGNGMSIPAATAFVTALNLSFVRFSTGVAVVNPGANNLNLSFGSIVSCQSVGLSATGAQSSTISVDWLLHNLSVQLLLNSCAGISVAVNKGCYDCSGTALSITGSELTLDIATIANTTTAFTISSADSVINIDAILGCITGMSLSPSRDMLIAVGAITAVAGQSNSSGLLFSGAAGRNITVVGGTTSNFNQAINTTNATGSEFNLVDFLINEVTEAVLLARANNRIRSHNHDKTVGNHIIFTDDGRIASATDQRHTASGFSWKFTPTAITRDSMYPLFLPLGKIALRANAPANIGVWCRRDNTNIKGRLRLPGGIYAAIPADVTVACEPAINTWVQYTLQVTPTEDVVAEPVFLVWDGVDIVNSFWIDDLTAV